VVLARNEEEDAIYIVSMAGNMILLSADYCRFTNKMKSKEESQLSLTDTPHS